MTPADIALLKTLCDAEGLVVGGTVESARRVGLIYADEKLSKPREPMTIVKNLEKRMAKAGVAFSITTANPIDSEFPTLWFTKREVVEARHG